MSPAELDELEADAFELDHGQLARITVRLCQEVRRLRAALVDSRAAIVGALGRFGIADVAALNDGSTVVNFVELGRAIEDLDEALTMDERAALYPVKP